MSIKDINTAHRLNRINETNVNNQGFVMTIIEYNNAKDILIEFNDINKTKVRTNYQNFKNGKVRNPNYKIISKKNKCQNRIGQENINNSGCTMKIVVYNNFDDIIVEFQDEYKGLVHTTYKNYLIGNVKNPYGANVCNIGITGNKYPTNTKEYKTWLSMIQRCFSEKEKIKCPTYRDVACCDEWLLYENFHDWLHSQENFEQWLCGKRWNVDKDILVKGNKIYAPEYCCLVPHNVNTLFIKCNAARGELPIGVHKNKNHFIALCRNPIKNKYEYAGNYPTLDEAFYLGYKSHKENIIKQVAQIEFDKGNIIKECYEAMMNYKVEITD